MFGCKCLRFIDIIVVESAKEYGKLFSKLTLQNQQVTGRWPIIARESTKHVENLREIKCPGKCNFKAQSKIILHFKIIQIYWK